MPVDVLSWLTNGVVGDSTSAVESDDIVVQELDEGETP